MSHHLTWPIPPPTPGSPRVRYPLARGPDGLDETAQVYARRAGEDRAAPLVFLPHGEAAAMRADARAGRIYCPVPDCPTPAFTTVGGRRRHHFRHLVAVRHASETIYHIISKDRIAAWLRVAHPDAVLDVDESNLENGRRADVLATLPSGRRVAFEIQAAALTRDELARRQHAYRSLGITDIWIWGPRYLALRLDVSGADVRRPDARPGACRQALWLDPYAGVLFVAGPPRDALGGSSVRWGDVYAEPLTNVRLGGRGLRGSVLDAVRAAVVEDARVLRRSILAAKRVRLAAEWMRDDAERERRGAARASLPMAPNPLPPVVGHDGQPWRPWPAPSLAELAGAAATTHVGAEPETGEPTEGGAVVELVTAPRDTPDTPPDAPEQLRLLG
jgi:Competence protein CoiA-like family